MLIQNNLYCSAIILFQALALLELKSRILSLLIKGLWIQVPQSEKIVGNFLVSVQIKDSDYQYLYLYETVQKYLANRFLINAYDEHQITGCSFL